MYRVYFTYFNSMAQEVQNTLEDALYYAMSRGFTAHIQNLNTGEIVARWDPISGTRVF